MSRIADRFGSRPLGRACAHCVALLCLLLVVGPGARADDPPGVVDCSIFKDIAGEDAVLIEVTLSGSLLKLFGAWDEELKEMVAGLESIHAVILDVSELDLPDIRSRASDTVRSLEKQLRKRGWERLAYIRDEDATVTVMLLSDEERVEGLVVMIAGEEEIVCANIAGVIDLAKLEELGEALDLPGLEDLEDKIEKD